MKILGIDHGTKRLGLALGDTETCLALPWKTIEVARADAARIITRIVAEERVDEVVVGLPIGGSQSPVVQSFVNDLHAALKIPVRTVDELMTSQIADRLRKESSVHSRDTLAATEILQSYLDQI